MKPALLLADDIAVEPEQVRRSAAVKSYALQLARRLGAPIDLVHVEDLSHYPVRFPLYKRLINRRVRGGRPRGGEFEAETRVPARTLFLSGAPAKKILALASRRNAYEMVVLGARGRVGVAGEVVRSARIPVLILGPKAQGRALPEQGGGPARILIPTGLSPDRAETYGVRLARRMGAEVVLFHSLHESLHPVLRTALSVPMPRGSVSGLLGKIRMSALRRLKARAARIFHREGVKATLLLDETPYSRAESILQEASAYGHSIIVVGAREPALGRIIQDAPVPVITVRP